MIKNIIVLVACIAIVALSWAFYAFFGKYVVSIFLTIVLISILATPVKRKFGHGKKTPTGTGPPITKKPSPTSEPRNHASGASADQQDE